MTLEVKRMTPLPLPLNLTWKHELNYVMYIDIHDHYCYVIGVTLSEPHTSLVYGNTCIDRPTVSVPFT